jgi:hypothetical protein
MRRFAVTCAAGLSVGLAAAGPSRPAGYKAGVSDGFVLHMLDAGTGALCLDGSPGGFYLRNGTQTSWMIELEGGGWCVNEEDCLARSKTDIGSSKSWPPTGCPSMDGEGASGGVWGARNSQRRRARIPHLPLPACRWLQRHAVQQLLHLAVLQLECSTHELRVRTGWEQGVVQQRICVLPAR